MFIFLVLSRVLQIKAKLISDLISFSKIGGYTLSGAFPGSRDSGTDTHPFPNSQSGSVYASAIMPIVSCPSCFLRLHPAYLSGWGRNRYRQKYDQQAVRADSYIVTLSKITSLLLSMLSISFLCSAT
jgi:hypothetical protein